MKIFFWPCSPVVLPPQKPTFLNFNSTWKQRLKRHSVDIPLQIPIYYLSLFFLIFVAFRLIHRYSGNRTPISIIRFLAIFVIAVHRYGDRAPISFIGRFLAIVVILSGLVIFGLVNGIMATSITSVTLETDYKIYGAKVRRCIQMME